MIHDSQSWDRERIVSLESLFGQTAIFLGAGGIRVGAITGEEPRTTTGDDGCRNVFCVLMDAAEHLGGGKVLNRHCKRRAFVSRFAEEVE
ncbi:MAG: hypothetical protein GXP42_05285 [Chloroflexi bacterium]|nr:hypothetical protein [Chloroflexota bacterium]